MGVLQKTTAVTASSYVVHPFHVNVSFKDLFASIFGIH